MDGDEVFVMAASESEVPGLADEVEFLRELFIETPPLALDDSAFERRGALLILAVKSPASHADPLAIEKRLRQTPGPEQLSRVTSLDTPTGGRVTRIHFLRDCGQADMLPSRAFPSQHVAGEIELMQALHNNDLDAGSGIIDAAAK